MRPDQIKDKKCFVLKDVKLDGMRGIKARFTNSLNTSKGDIRIDSPDGGRHIGVVMFSNGKAEDECRAEIDAVSGVHDVYITVSGSAVITDIAFTPDSPYDAVSYVPAPESRIIDNGHDTWEATDMLGRKIPSVEDVGAKKPERKVGIFYWTWREHAVGLYPVNVSKLLDEFPAAEYNRKHPGWTDKPIQPHWGEPRYGFYRNSDPYVIRHHAAMLSDAGLRAAAYPAREFCLHHMTASHDLERERLSVLYRAISGDFDAIATTPFASLQPTVSAERLAGAGTVVRQGAILSPDELEENDALKEKLLLSPQDARLIRSMNMFAIKPLE